MEKPTVSTRMSPGSNPGWCTKWDIVKWLLLQTVNLQLWVRVPLFQQLTKNEK